LREALLKAYDRRGQKVFQRRQGRALVGVHFPGIADDIGGDYGGQPPPCRALRLSGFVVMKKPPIDGSNMKNLCAK
jgi:hypothetical protein